MSEGSDDRGDQSELMRAGVRDRVARLAQAAGSGTRRWSPPVLLAALSAEAFAPLLVSVTGGAAVGAAAVSAATAVGGNVLTDVIKAGVTRIRGKEPTGQEFQEALEQWIQQALEESGPRARELRAELAGILARIDAVGAGIEEVVRIGDRELQIALTSGLAELAAEFSEFGFVLAEVEARLLSIRESVDRSRAGLREAATNPR